MQCRLLDYFLKDLVSVHIFSRHGLTLVCKRHLPHTTQHTVHSQRHTLLEFFVVFTFICVFRTWGMIIILARFSNEKVL